MPPIFEQYSELYKKIKGIRERIGAAEAVISGIESERETDVPKRIAALKESIEKVDEYTLKIAAFRKLAEKNLESTNVQTIEAPPGYRVNLNRLRAWAMMIDPSSSNDPYAQRVNFVAKCDELFLSKKRKEFTERITLLENGESTAMTAEIAEQRRKIDALKEELHLLANGDDVSAFAEAVVQLNKKYWHEASPEAYTAKVEMPAALSPGAYALPFDFEPEQRKLLKAMFAHFYDADNGRVLLPIELSTATETAIAISCAPARTKQLDRGLQNYILDLVDKYPAGLNKIYILDAVRYNSTLLGPLKQLENTFAIEQIPRNQEQLSAKLEEIVSSFSDMDDVLELYDSVNEYNEKNDLKRKLSKTTIIIFGWPNAFEGRDREYVQRIMTNYERYGVTFVSVSYGANDESEAAKTLPEYAAHNARYITMSPNETIFSGSDNRPQRFTWYTLSNELQPAYVDALKAVKVDKVTTGNEYIKRYDISDLPLYTREYKKIELPFGIDSKDVAHSVSFENENFAAYLVGASRSGKSTLLHTLIAGILRNFHPDNVELWLADFKQLEFKKYIEHCPPHVKYVLLDESTELVYDLIDRLTDKMMERQRAFARLGKERIDQLDPRDLSEPMPVIFVILDEFSIMSQAIAESQAYRLRLQNLLAKGAALGIKFLFASQTFTTGIAGLTPTARAQIQQRIAMKGTREEIGETLELSANLKTEQVGNWMDALPPHYALQKFRISADQLPQVRRVLVMYFKDYDVRDALIDRLNRSMKAAETYVPNEISNYVDKHPVLVDGNTFDAFNEKSFVEFINELKHKQKDAFTGDETFLSLGTPRLMTRMKAIALTQEARENMLLVARSAEQSCQAAIISSAVKSYLAQGKNVQIWAYDKNRLFMAYRNTAWKADDYKGVVFREGIHAVCDAIYDMKQKIRGKQHGDELIVLIGMDRICADFEFIEEADNASGVVSADHEQKQKEREAALRQSGAVVDSDEAETTRNTAMAWLKEKREVIARLKTEGKEGAELTAALDAAKAKFFEAQSDNIVITKSSVTETPPAATPATTTAAPHTPGEYNAKDDFQYIVKQGSRLGYHFMLCLNSFADLKQTALRLDIFRHRLAFQVSAEDSRELFGNKNASTLPEHICQYYDSLERYSFRPYLHRDIGWEGWQVDGGGKAVNPFGA